MSCPTNLRDVVQRTPTCKASHALSASSALYDALCVLGSMFVVAAQACVLAKNPPAAHIYALHSPATSHKGCAEALSKLRQRCTGCASDESAAVKPVLLKGKLLSVFKCDRIAGRPASWNARNARRKPSPYTSLVSVRMVWPTYAAMRSALEPGCTAVHALRRARCSTLRAPARSRSRTTGFDPDKCDSQQQQAKGCACAGLLHSMLQAQHVLQ